jgi:hypothetical protein
LAPVGLLVLVVAAGLVWARRMLIALVAGAVAALHVLAGRRRPC